MKKNLLIAGAMLLIMTAFSFNKAQAQTCVMPPSCEDLGYKQTEADCEGLDIVLKCPTDMTKMACLGSSESQDVSVGAILYGDGTVASGLVAGKKPIGIVFDVFNRFALALTTEKMYWSDSSCDTPNLENCESNDKDPKTTCGIDGRANTDAILASTCNGTTYAANAANDYQPDGCTADFCQKGKWFLPSYRDLHTIYSFKSVVNNSLTLLSAAMIGGEYWSSTEFDSDWAMTYCMSDSCWSNGHTKYDSKNIVRPVLAF